MKERYIIEIVNIFLSFCAESHKTIDKKTLYKTADICQLLICKEGESSDDDYLEEDEKKKDPNKVDKKFIYPHGITPPLKNCRKRRFRKTLKKKHCLDEPEIEKEVKRLFRNDNEAVNVKWQLLTEEEYNAGKTAGGSSIEKGDTNLGEQDLFGDLSDIEHDGPDHDRSDSKIEPPSEGDSTMYGELDQHRPGPSSGSTSQAQVNPGGQLVTEFSKDMFQVQGSGGQDAVAVRSARINVEINELIKQKQEIEKNLTNCPNPVLQQKLRETLMAVEHEIRQKEMEAEAFAMFS